MQAPVIGLGPCRRLRSRPGGTICRPEGKKGLEFGFYFEAGKRLWRVTVEAEESTQFPGLERSWKPFLP